MVLLISKYSVTSETSSNTIENGLRSLICRPLSTSNLNPLSVNPIHPASPSPQNKTSPSSLPKTPFAYNFRQTHCCHYHLPLLCPPLLPIPWCLLPHPPQKKISCPCQHTPLLRETAGAKRIVCIHVPLSLADLSQIKKCLGSLVTDPTTF